MNKRLIHDAAAMIAMAILDRLNLRDEEKAHCYEELHDICKAGIEAYEIQNNRMQRRLNPLQN
jgi:hypothetical protein